MKKQTLLFPMLGLSVLLTGCVGVGPNTQQGAVTGGALGAIAGAMIGNNSRGGSALGGALLGGYVGALAGGTIGNSVDHERGTIYRNYNQAYASRVEVRDVPPTLPPPIAGPEAVPVPPAPEAIWIPGAWSFNGSAYSWIAGSWAMPPPHLRTYIAAHWERNHGRYLWVQSYWR